MKASRITNKREGVTKKPNKGSASYKMLKGSASYKMFKESAYYRIWTSDRKPISFDNIEKAVLEATRQGIDNKEICKRLKIPPQKLKKIRNRLIRKNEEILLQTNAFSKTQREILRELAKGTPKSKLGRKLGKKESSIKQEIKELNIADTQALDKLDESDSMWLKTSYSPDPEMMVPLTAEKKTTIKETLGEGLSDKEAEELE